MYVSKTDYSRHRQAGTLDINMNLTGSEYDYPL